MTKRDPDLAFCIDHLCNHAFPRRLESVAALLVGDEARATTRLRQAMDLYVALLGG